MPAAPSRSSMAQLVTPSFSRCSVDELESSRGLGAAVGRELLRNSVGYPLCNGQSYLIGRILLHEVNAADCHLILVGPCVTELPHPPGKDRLRLGVDEQLGKWTLRHPSRVRARDLGDVLWPATRRHLPRAGRRRPMGLSRTQERSPEFRRLLLPPRTVDAPRAWAVHDCGRTEHRPLAPRRSRPLEDLS